MDLCKAEYALRDLDDLDIDNLIAGRFTKEAMNTAIRRLKKQHDFDVQYLGVGMIASVADRVLADELNDMLEAAQYCHKIGRDRSHFFDTRDNDELSTVQ